MEIALQDFRAARTFAGIDLGNEAASNVELYWLRGGKRSGWQWV
jgi:hypothetical protein